MSTAPPGRRGRADRWATSSALKAAALVFTVVGGVTAIVALSLQIADRWTVATPGPSVPVVSNPVPGPSCLDDGYQVVDCREPHRLEKVDGPCSTGDMLNYMSGRAGTDVVLATVRPWSGECQAAAEMYMRQTLAGVGDQLTVRVVAEVDPDPSAPRCLIAVRGTQPLTASVRNLGINPVPFRR